MIHSSIEAAYTECSQWNTEPIMAENNSKYGMAWYGFKYG